MPSFKPFSSMTGRNSCSLFDIRLDNDFIVFRGNEHESAGQILKGVVVLCLPSPLRMEDVRLRLTGTLKMSHSTSGHKSDKTTTILEHRWSPFVGTHGKSMTLPAGNYEYPFEYMLPGDTSESVEGIPEASVTYRLKATVGRGKLSYDLHAAKHLRIIRTLEPGALEFHHAMSVENIWPNKIDYSIVIPQKAVAFGGVVDLEMRFTPLLKGLELGDITVKLIELRDCSIKLSTGQTLREHRTERSVSNWRFEVSREDHWQDMIEDTGQDGWTMTRKLNLPRKLKQCTQDLDQHGIKVRHKLKLTVSLKNPDGHISELRATLPISIFISPNMPLDEEGNMVNQNPDFTELLEGGAVAPPGYGEHILDQLYEDVDTSGFMTPAVQSGFSSPFYSQSRTGSSDNIASISLDAPFPPAALSSRLADVSLDPSQRNASFNSIHLASGVASGIASPSTIPRSEPQSNNLSRSNSEESGRDSPEHIDIGSPEFAQLNRVPSYTTAVKTPARPQTSQPNDTVLPDYQTALNTPRTPPATDLTPHEALTTISEDAPGEDQVHRAITNTLLGRSQSNETARNNQLNIIRGRDQAV